MRRRALTLVEVTATTIQWRLCYNQRTTIKISTRATAQRTVKHQIVATMRVWFDKLSQFSDCVFQLYWSIQ